MAVLVAGGAGYIGSVTVERLVASGEEVVVLDDLATGYRAAVDEGTRFVEGRTHDTERLAGIFADHKIDTVIHFAAYSLVGESCTDPRKYFVNNVAGSQTLLHAMLDAGIGRFVFSSTAAVYGNPDSVPITEDMALRPLNPYGASKRMVEITLDAYAEAYGLQHATLRYFNAAGASERFGEAHDPETHLIPNVLRAATGEQDGLDIFGDDYDTRDGTCVRDYIHVEDLADAHLLAMNHLREGGASDVFNLGTSKGTTVREVVETAERVTGRTVPVRVAPRRAGDAEQLVASSDRARERLGWQPRKDDVETIIADAWRWMEAHPGGYGE
jgi:UDP-glucose 4-epimerase